MIEAEEPIYTLAEAARYVASSAQTIARWRAGYSFPTRTGRGQSSQLTSGATSGRLSFTDLLEVAVVAAARKANIPMRAVRRAIDAAKDIYNVEQPLVQIRFKHDGREIFTQELEEGGRDRFVNLSRRGQIAWQHIEDVLQNLDYNGDGIAYRWWPAGHDEPIVIDPRVSFGRPYVFRRGVSTDAVRSRFRAGQSLDDIADDLSMSVPEAEAALRFEMPEAA